ncbi:MAG: hypothetical protein ACRYGK_07485 [Janthinobacterium lividum]
MTKTPAQKGHYYIGAQRLRQKRIDFDGGQNFSIILHARPFCH